ncbi:MAG: Gfo/Idh/MocA family oxidoreductase, partial [Firmicutes bacterium]|nr:Gfo/Idh/MocA family oxidoreductase [Bacillota bacterium]
MIPYAILGTGWISEAFYAASLSADLVLRGVCSRTPESGLAFAHKIGQPGLPVFTSVEAIAAAPGIDAVYIASPNFLHAPQCEALLHAGKHVLCEKPVVTRPDDLARLQAIARKQGLILMEAIMYLQTPARQAVKAALPALGEITSAHFDFTQLSSKYDALARGELPNIFNPAMGTGAFNDLGVYCVYPALDFFGPPL